MENLIIGGIEFKNRLFIGTGKYPDRAVIKEVAKQSESEIITVAVRRVDLNSKGENILNFIPENLKLLPNTSGARNAEEAVRIARLAKASGCGNFIKIEVISDNKYLLPDNFETIKATKILSQEGFIVLPYMVPDLIAAKALVKAGAAAVMPLGSPIGSNRGIRTEEMVQIIINEINEVPVIIDAGIGKPSDATKAMEMGADAVLVNTAIASADEPSKMAEAFKYAVRAGRIAYCAKIGKERKYAAASSPLTGFLEREA